MKTNLLYSKSKKVTSLNQRKKIVLMFAPTNWLFRSDGGLASSDGGAVAPLALPWRHP